MAFNKVTTYAPEINFLESEIGLITKTFTGKQTDATTVDGKKIIKAGSVHKVNGAAVGLVFESVDMTDDTERPISVIVAGRVYENRLPASVTADKDDLKDITFLTATTPSFDAE